MSSSNDELLCNGIPADHRLTRYLQKIKPTYSQSVGGHANIIENFGNKMARSDGTFPSENEARFASWLAKPDTQGGLVIALLQPAPTQVYHSDVQRVVDECPTLAYIEDSLAFMNGSRTLANTSVFDAFPFITKQVTSEGYSGRLSDEARWTNERFLEMIEAKKPDVVFACWRVAGHEHLPFSGKGLGPGTPTRLRTLPNGHTVRVVNGFHPSFIARYRANESCFRRLFTMELCKAFCEIDGTWQEEPWMDALRSRCQDRMRQLRDRDENGGHVNNEDQRFLRGSRPDGVSQKYEAYARSFDNGFKDLKELLEHVTSTEYWTQPSSSLYTKLVEMNASETVCDALLAISEATKPLTSGNSYSGSLSNRLSNHVSRQIHDFVLEHLPNFVKDLNAQLQSRSRRADYLLSGKMLTILLDFVTDIAKSFTQSAIRSWTYSPDGLYRAFRDVAINIEKLLGELYDYCRLTEAASTSDGMGALTTSFGTMSFGSPRAAGSTQAAGYNPYTRPRSSNCYNCGENGHFSSECPNPRRARDYTTTARTPPRTSSNMACYRCGREGHWSRDCTSPSRGSPSSSGSSPDTTCYKCGRGGHWARDCSSSGRESPTPRKVSSNMACYKCRQEGHWARDCTNERTIVCYRCGREGHYASACR